MGIKHLWTILSPYSERKPICELKHKIVAIDLAGWICEGLNVVDYFVNPKHHLRNLFFRMCFLIWEQITPVFVLDGDAPSLKNFVITQRQTAQFRGVQPKKSEKVSATENKQRSTRKRFNYVLKECEMLLNSLGIPCVKAPGEAEAFCSFLNKKGVVDGVISQDSDCFAYGATCVYRNFSITRQGGSVDVYDLNRIHQSIDFGQNKSIALAIISGCDYTPGGFEGAGRESVMQFFDRYDDKGILERIRNWQSRYTCYTEPEIRAHDDAYCSSCGHVGNTKHHARKGCVLCHTLNGCDDGIWKKERLAIRAEVSIRKKVLSHHEYPIERIITEFLSTPEESLSLPTSWMQPDVSKFIKKLGPQLHWSAIECFQKIFPILARWHVRHPLDSKILVPQQIVKSRKLKGNVCLEVLWKETNGVLIKLIPDEQLINFNKTNDQRQLWITIENLHEMEVYYPDLVQSFSDLKTAPKKKRVQLKAASQKQNSPHEMECKESKKSNDPIFQLHSETFRNSACDFEENTSSSIVKQIIQRHESDNNIFPQKLLLELCEKYY